MLVDFISAHQDQLVAMTRATSRQHPDGGTVDGPNDGLPLFLEDLKGKLRADESAASIRMDVAAARHGGALLRRGYSVAQVVHDYGALCQAITELADEERAPITTNEFRKLNRCLDDAIAEAVTEYVRLHDENLAAGETERSGVFAHELRNRLSAAQLGFDAIRSGRAPVAGAVANVVARSLEGIAELIDRSLLEVRIDSGLTQSQRVRLGDVIDEVHEAAALEAARRGVMLSVAAVDPKVEVDIDPQILRGILGNLFQNALKFTARGGLVRAFVEVVPGRRVEVRVEDECGGLPPGKLDELFGAFQQRGKNRTGLGLGLFISRRGVEASGGSIYVRDVPKHGCVFTVDLPLASPPS